MTPGHFGLAAGAKQVAPRLPLWALFLATYLLDVIFVFLLAAGIEGLTPIEPAHPNAYGGVLVHAYYTHSLVGALLLSAIAGWLANRRWGKREGQVVAALVFSHWLLDLLVHRADMPLLPGNIGNLPFLGFGLWEYPVVSAVIELVLVVGGAYFYHRSVMASHQGRRAWTASLVTAALLILLFVTNTLGL